VSDDVRRVTNPPGVRVGASPTIRVAVKALVVEDDRLLVTVNGGHDETFYLCPGGGQHHGEDAHQALRRECLEEVGCAVVVGELAFVRDYIGAEHEFAEHDGWVHQQELYFFCALVPGEEPRMGTLADTFQTGVTWLALEGLSEEPLWPKALTGWLATRPAERPRYLGSVN
jgi:ADP-ribose pyrophosphatase YjhB (NUDIX family)